MGAADLSLLEAPGYDLELALTDQDPTMGVALVSRVSVVAAALLVSACASPNLPENYQSRNLPGAVDCSAYPETPAPASCRNLYEGIIHPPQALVPGFPPP
jgi:hypothetical protein